MFPDPTWTTAPLCPRPSHARHLSVPMERLGFRQGLDIPISGHRDDAAPLDYDVQGIIG